MSYEVSTKKGWLSPKMRLVFDLYPHLVRLNFNEHDEHRTGKRKKISSKQQ